MLISLRRGTAAQWAAKNPVLAAGEPAVATDTGILKIGDGVTVYSALPSIGAGTPAVDPSAAALGLAAHTFPPQLASNFFALNSGTFVANLVQLPGTSVSKMGIALKSAGVTSGGVNVMGLYRLAAANNAVLVDSTVDMTAAFAGAAGHITGNLSAGAQTPAAGAYYLATLTHFTTAPNVATTADVSAPFGTAGLPPINGRYSTVFIAAQAALPASFDPTAASLNSVDYYMTIG